MPSLSRRDFLARSSTAGAAFLAAGPALSSMAAGNDKVPMAEAFDREVKDFMDKRNVPGAALAVVKDRRLVYAHGYGWADREKKEEARPDSLFRIASISKPFTAVAVMKLVEAGKLDLETPAMDFLGLKPLPSQSQKPDARLKQITMRHLLHHTGGWDRDKSGDAMFFPVKIAKAAGAPSPALQESIIRYMLTQPLDTDPGAHYAYSNLGFCILGRVIEKISGMKYDDFVRREVFEPASIKRMRLGRTLESERADGEVKYYTPENEMARSVFASHSGQVPEPYGGFCLEAMDSHGGWLASAVDLARFAAALDADAEKPLLAGKSRAILYEAPAPPVSRKADGTLSDFYYGCGWDVRPVGNRGKANYWHNGSLPGTSTMLVRRWDGLSWAMLFNQRSRDSKLPDGAIDGALHRAANSVAEWPDKDLFQQYA